MKSLLKLAPYLRPFKGTIAFALIFAIVIAATNAVVPRFSKELTDEYLGQGQQGLRLPLLLVLVFLVHALARFFHMYLLKMMAEKITVRIRSDLQKKFMTLNLNFHNSYAAGSGGMLSRILNDVTVVQWGFTIMADLVREPLVAIAMVVSMVAIDWKLTVVTFLIAPPILILSRQLAKSLRKYSHKQQESLEDTTSTLKETLDGVRIIQSFNLEQEMSRRFEKVSDQFLSHRSKIIAREEMAGPVSELMAVLVVAVIVVFMGDRIRGGEATIGTFFGFLTALVYLNPPVKKIQDAYLRLQQTVAATERLFQILDSHEEVPQSVSTKPFPKTWDSIHFQNVSFSYGDKQVLKNINLKVRKGEVVALVGESGSGKSTLMNLMGRFFDPTEGQIFIGDTPIRDINLKELRRNIALVTQDVFLFNDSIERNIQAGDFDRSNGDVREAAQIANAHDFIMRIGEHYDARVGDRGGRLSGGERQRISIARAVYKNAPILILDEATSALDSASEVEVQKGLDQLMKGRTAFVIAHRLSTVINADRILVLKDGEIVEDGRHEGLIAKQGSYYNFYKLQTLR